MKNCLDLGSFDALIGLTMCKFIKVKDVILMNTIQKGLDNCIDCFINETSSSIETPHHRRFKSNLIPMKRLNPIRLNNKR